MVFLVHLFRQQIYQREVFSITRPFKSELLPVVIKKDLLDAQKWFLHAPFSFEESDPKLQLLTFFDVGKFWQNKKNLNMINKVLKL